VCVDPPGTSQSVCIQGENLQAQGQRYEKQIVLDALSLYFPKTVWGVGVQNKIGIGPR